MLRKTFYNNHRKKFNIITIRYIFNSEFKFHNNELFLKLQCYFKYHFPN